MAGPNFKACQGLESRLVKFQYILGIPDCSRNPVYWLCRLIREDFMSFVCYQICTKTFSVLSLSGGFTPCWHLRPSSGGEHTVV